MAEILPFRGWRPPAKLAPNVACLPYDVVSTEEARRFAGGRPECFFRVSRPEIDLPPGIDEHSESVYRLGAQNLKEFIDRGFLRRDFEPSLYVYRQRMGDHVQTGVVGLASVREYDRGEIKKHELTRADKEDDRTRHVDTLGGNDEPVFLTYRARREVDEKVQEITGSPPEVDFTSSDQITHTFWVPSPKESTELAAIFTQVSPLYISDGHHRSAAASRVDKLREARRQAGSHGHFLAVVFPHDQLRILDYNRVVKDLNGLTSEVFLTRARERFEVIDPGSSRPIRRHEVGLFLGNHWLTLVARPGTFEETPIGALDVSILQTNLLGPVLGIEDPRTSQRIQFVGGIRGTRELERMVKEGEGKAAFAMFPPGLDELMAIADAGLIMPPKSTWFEPKLRSGLVLHLF